MCSSGNWLKKNFKYFLRTKKFDNTGKRNYLDDHSNHENDSLIEDNFDESMIVEEDMTLEENSDCSSDYLYCEETDVDTPPANPKNCPVLNFQIILNKREWLKIKPIDKISKDDYVYQRLNYYWTDLIVEKIYETKKLPCPFSFKDCKVLKKDPDKYFHFKGKCKDCKTEVYGWCCETSLNDKGLISCNINTFDTRGIKHTEKRKFSGEDRIIGKKVLAHQKAAAYKLQRIKEKCTIKKNNQVHNDESETVDSDTDVL